MNLNPGMLKPLKKAMELIDEKDRIKYLDFVTEETEELMEETKKYAKLHGLDYKAALEIVSKREKWQKERTAERMKEKLKNTVK